MVIGPDRRNHCFRGGYGFVFRCRLSPFRQFIQQAGKFQLPEKVGDFISIVVTGMRGLHIQRHRCLCHNRRQYLALTGDICIVPQQCLQLRRGHFIQVVVNLLDGAELLNQFYGGLFPDALDAGNIIRRVAL